VALPENNIGEGAKMTSQSMTSYYQWRS